ncbi:hypothetical protein [Salinicoccus roseus]|uniref:Uncharacterized protein n=1 Tax=Salinicoccus roseus TaxID=45670 RepID=A0ABT4YKL9_9STAP|nr:hypothetical protein [Salinicoccus roseus]MDB0581234.1 hypothetical protein [Salinicoccus roseus]
MSELFPVEKNFRDGQDNKRLYEKDGWYPRRGLEASDERVAELQEKGFIGGEGASDEAPEGQNDGPGTDYPKHTGGGYYELSNGEKVQGKEEAEKAEQELSEAPQE